MIAAKSFGTIKYWDPDFFRLSAFNIPVISWQIKLRLLHISRFWVGLLNSQLSVLSLLWLLVLGKDYHEATENVNEVQEQINGMPDKVPISSCALGNNQLSVIQHKATEQQKPTIQLNLENKLGSHKQIDNRQKTQDAQTWQQGSSQVKVGSLFCPQSTQCEANKYQCCGKECCGDDAWINLDDNIHQRAKT